ncbi:MAG: ABC transporter substrate-binding protein [Actinomycetota bacterium]|nr:ABC transporter substrate-binding protein [Actinomycetota bacterium]
MYTRRAFLSRSARVAGGLTIVGALPVLSACGGDDDDSGDAAATGPITTQFNWLPDIEWSAWYLAESKGYFADRGVESTLSHGGPNTPAVVQVLAAGDGNVGLSASELDIIKANQEGSDFVVIGAMYQRNPLGFTWMTETGISTIDDLVGKRIGGPQGDQVQIDAVFRVNGMEPDYEFIPMGFDPQPLADGEMDAIASYVTNQPLQLQLQGYDASAAPYSDFGLPSYGDIIFASRAWIDENRDLVVGYLAALLQGAMDNRADPSESLPILVEDYAADAEINEEYAEVANPAYIELMDSDYTDANGLLSVDPEKMENEVLPGLETAGETDLPTVDEFLDTSLLEEAHELLS